MTKLSVNINKIATLRNARGGNMPDVTKAAIDCETFGAEGITVHPRPDGRHIRYDDVRAIRPLVRTEFNIEGNPIPSFMDLVLETAPDQVTLVPDAENAITSDGGWDTIKHRDFLIQKQGNKDIHFHKCGPGHGGRRSQMRMRPCRAIYRTLCGNVQP